MTDPRVVALIPARAGSKRLPGKNVRDLAGHPLLAYTIAAAVESGVFARVILSTDSEEYAEIARRYGAETPFLRPTEMGGDASPDIDWIRHALTTLAAEGQTYDAFSILRPTSPFRQAETIRRAWKAFLAEEGVDSLRAVEKSPKHPGKMWVIRGRRMFPLMPFEREGVPWHSNQSQTLPPVYAQNASLEIAWTRVALDQGSIAGDVVVPFVSEGYEGFDVNTTLDFALAELLVERGEATLPRVP